MRPRDAIDVVVAKLPPPDRLKKGGGERPAPEPSYDDGGDVGEESAFNEFVDAMGITPRDRKAARAALRDMIAICAQASEGTDEGDTG